MSCLPRAPAAPLSRAMLTQSRVTAQCSPQPQDPDRQTPSFGQGPPQGASHHESSLSKYIYFYFSIYIYYMYILSTF